MHTPISHPTLAPYAVPLNGLLGRMHEESEDTTRSAFQRDRDRIIHSQAFRRLKGKPQVFVEGEGDHFRTRLTHTMEVAQLSRDIARTLMLNEDLAECIALAHDLGHPPFGHAGEKALDAFMQEHGEHFEHNEQSLRIVELLEVHSTVCFHGLNLNREVLEGMMKHRSLLPEAVVPDRSPSLEAQLVDLADAIAYTAHDADDGLRSGLFTLDDITQTTLAASANTKATARGTPLRGALIDLVVSDLYQTTEQQIQEQTIATIDDVYTSKKPIVSLSPKLREQFSQLHKFLQERMYGHPSVTSHNQRGQQMLSELCTQYQKDPPKKVLQLQERTESSLEIAIKDYIAGMTDRYAKQKYTTKNSPNVRGCS